MIDTFDDGIPYEELPRLIGRLFLEDPRDENWKFVFGTSFDAETKSTHLLPGHADNSNLNTDWIND